MLRYHTYPAPIDVISYSAIAARIPQDYYGYEGRSHSLWFCDAYDAGQYRWFELAFMTSVMSRVNSSVDPFALAPTDTGAGALFAPGVAGHQIAWEPLPFDQGNEDQFVERWLGWLAAAADGSLRHPSSMPENSGGRHRQAT